MTLEVDCEERIGEVLVRWVRVPAHLQDSCSCGETDALLVSCPGRDLWLPGGVFPLGAGRAFVLDTLIDEEWESWNAGAARMAAALGVPWGALTLSVMLGLLALAHGLDDETLFVIGAMETEALLALRRTNTRPADAVRCLRLLRGAMESTQ